MIIYLVTIECSLIPLFQIAAPKVSQVLLIELAPPIMWIWDDEVICSRSYGEYTGSGVIKREIAKHYKVLLLL